MTGKGCVYTDQIDQALEERKNLEGASSGFMIMPFRPKLKVFFQNCLQPFFQANYGGPARLDASDAKESRFSLTRADDVSRPGIIICEGICKRIQESDFVIADISVPNDNVFYELGLAYGIDQKIALIHQRGAKFGQLWAKYLRADESGTRADTKVKEYDNLEFIKREDFKVSQYFWKRSDRARAGKPADPEILFFEMMNDGQKAPEPPPTEIDDTDISLSFRTHVMSDIGLALNSIAFALKEQQRRKKNIIPEEYIKEIISTHLDKAHIVEPSDPFEKTRDRVDNCYCLIVRTGKDCHPMSYFWLGYGHARGKNVIPITQLIVDGEADNSKAAQAKPEPRKPSKDEASSQPTNTEKGKIVDLAFDIRAQRHMTFDPLRPELLEHQLERTLTEMIRADFSEWSRRRFWAKLLGNRGEVSIITGGLHSEDHNREMIGDWDLRAASELTSYFSRHQYRPKIETPIYQPEFARKFDPEMTAAAYVEQVTKDIRIGDKNCVVIASPDVNPLTEILLGRLNKVPDSALFSDGFKPKSNTHAIIVYKQRKKAQPAGADHPATDGARAASSDTAGRDSKIAKRAFYQEVTGNENVEQRGFLSEGFADDNTRMLPYYGQNEHQRLEGNHFHIYAQLIVARNPFTEAGRPPRYVIILNGVSGPATFALTHVLTGGGNEEFESYRESQFDPAASSESILNKLLPRMDDSGLGCIESVIKVRVGVNPRKEPTEVGERSPKMPYRNTAGTGATFDWRRILSWELDRDVLGDEFRKR